MSAVLSRISDREFDDLHAEALAEGAQRVRITLAQFIVAAERQKWSDATALLSMAREQIEEFDVKDVA